MAEAIQADGIQQQSRTADRVAAISIIGAHTLEHVYARSFNVLIPSIYVALGLTPLQTGAMEGVRQFSSGLTSMVSGLFVDVFPHRRGQILALSFALIAIGYFLVAVAPTYLLIVLALAFASAGSALWHPPALGLLAEKFPQNKGLFISLHRSAGNIGDSIGPLVVGLLLGVMGWRWIVGGGSPVMLGLAVIIMVSMWRVGGPKPENANFGENLSAQFTNMTEALKGTGMWSVFAVSALRGMADTSLLWVIPLYLSQELDKSNFVMGFHVALLAAPGIVTGPMFGELSDRIGRKSIIVFVMAVTVVLPIGMVLGGGGWVMTLSIALFGIFYFTVNSLTQAAAIDIAEGKRLESTFIGLMWGGNAFFGAASSIVAGWIVGQFGWPPAFYFAAALFFVGFISSVIMPSTGGTRPVRESASAR